MWYKQAKQQVRLQKIAAVHRLNKEEIIEGMDSRSINNLLNRLSQLATAMMGPVGRRMKDMITMMLVGIFSDPSEGSVIYAVSPDPPITLPNGQVVTDSKQITPELMCKFPYHLIKGTFISQAAPAGHMGSEIRKAAQKLGIPLNSVNARDAVYIDAISMTYNDPSVDVEKEDYSQIGQRFDDLSHEIIRLRGKEDRTPQDDERLKQMSEERKKIGQETQVNKHRAQTISLTTDAFSDLFRLRVPIVAHMRENGSYDLFAKNPMAKNKIHQAGYAYCVTDKEENHMGLGENFYTVVFLPV